MQLYSTVQLFATVKSHSSSYLCNDAYEQDTSNIKQGELWGRINELCPGSQGNRTRGI